MKGFKSCDVRRLVVRWTLNLPRIHRLWKCCCCFDDRGCDEILWV